MAKITLTVHNSKVRQVRARVNNDKDGGNAVLPRQDTVDWQANGADEFRVVFHDLDHYDPNTGIWPFEGGDDGPFGPSNLPSLKVTGGGKTRVLKPDAPRNIKYEVYCTSGADADPLDPMIIIRPSSFSDSVVLGVSCAVLGAITGALVTMALLR